MATSPIIHWEELAKQMMAYKKSQEFSKDDLIKAVMDLKEYKEFKDKTEKTERTIDSIVDQEIKRLRS